VVVVLPTPPFWLATVKIRVEAGLAIASLSLRTPITELVDVSRESSPPWFMALSKHPF
jgi:hypothetical protein